MNTKAVNKYRNKIRNKGRKGTCRVRFWQHVTQIMHEEYLNVYESIQSEIVNTTRFNENLDLSTMYLGRSDKARKDKLRAEESFQISEHGYTSG